MKNKAVEPFVKHIGVLEEHPSGVQPRFKVGDRVQVLDMPYLFYTRTQMWARGVVGTIAALTYPDLIPEDEAFGMENGLVQQYYIIRFRQKDVWPEYPFENDTIQTESPERWLELATN